MSQLSEDQTIIKISIVSKKLSLYDQGIQYFLYYPDSSSPSIFKNDLVFCPEVSSKSRCKYMVGMK